VTTYQKNGVGATLRSVFVVVLLAVGAITTIATAAAFFGDLWWGFDLAANYRWHLMWIAIITAVLFALSARGVATVVFIAAALVNAWLVAPLWIGDQPPATGEDGVRIVQIDLGGTVKDDGTALRWLFRSEGDLIVISGVTRDRIAPLVADGSPYRMLAAPLSPDRTGIVILGKDAWNVNATSTEAGDTVYRVTVPSGNGLVDVVTAWGEMATSGEAADALAQRLAVVGDTVDAADNPVAVVGNVGATRWSKGMRDLQSTSELRDASEGSGYLSTSPISSLPLIGGWVGLPIDIVFMESTLTPLELVTGPDIGAEHLPVTVVVGPAFEN
jgi:endonuclease/exonuclease/phosphatase (EEP) superfamily protein YafD